MVYAEDPRIPQVPVGYAPEPAFEAEAGTQTDMSQQGFVPTYPVVVSGTYDVTPASSQPQDDWTLPQPSHLIYTTAVVNPFYQGDHSDQGGYADDDQASTQF